MDSGNLIIAGLMSGTSLDGLDIAICEFNALPCLSYRIIAATTIGYHDELKCQLKNAHLLDAYSLLKLHNEFGDFVGNRVKEFIQNQGISVDYIASHGHTIFHNPQEGITFQLGNGANIAARSELKVISDFRTTDVAFSGQGAPLVPIGDKLLFRDYSHCLNIGGIANISIKDEDSIIAYDICPANMALNYIVNQIGLSYDDEGDLASKGKTIEALIKQLNELDYYRMDYPKSTGREWFEAQMKPIIDTYSDYAINDVLNTLVNHVAYQIGRQIAQPNSAYRMIITGGGAHNVYLVEQIKSNCTIEIVVPDKETIDYKEALIFALLGYLRVNKQNNCLASVTGSKIDNCGGAIFHFYQVD